MLNIKLSLTLVWFIKWRRMIFKSSINRLFNNREFKLYAKNTIWMFLEQILRMIAGLFVGIWVARYLGPSQFGIFSYALAFTAIFSGIAKLGLDGIVIRELVKYPEKKDIYLGTAFWLKVIGGIITFGVMIIATKLTSNDLITNVYILIIASGIIFQSFEVIDFYFQSKVLSKFVSICKMIQLLLSSILKIYLVLSGAGLLWFVLVSLFDQISLAISLWLAYRSQKIGSFFRSFDLITGVGLLKDSWPLILSSLMVMIYMRVDQVMIKEMLGEREVGLYSAALKLSEVWYFVPMIITSSLFPAILSAKKQSQDLYYMRLQQLYDMLTLMSISIAVSMTFLSDWIVSLLYGAQFDRAGSVLMIHIWSGVFVFLGVARSCWVLSENLQMYSFIYLLVGLVVNIICNFMFIPIYGINGAALATLLAQCFGTLVAPFFLKKMRISFYMMINSLNLFSSIIRFMELHHKKNE